MTNSSSTYWLYDWLDENDVSTVDEARRALGTKAGFLGLIEHASTRSPKIESANELVAGLGMDLSGSGGCVMPKCLKREAGELVHRTWHLFDSVTANGLDRSRFLEVMVPNARQEMFLVTLLSHIEVALYVRAIGAADFLLFRDKPVYCKEHLAQHAEEVGFAGGIEVMASRLEQTLIDGMELRHYEDLGERLIWAAMHPLLESGSVGVLRDRPFIGPDMVRSQAARSMAHEFAAMTIMNSALARSRNAPLGQLASALPELEERRRGRPTREDVAFHVAIPIVKEVPVEEMLLMRREYAADFHAFQAALRRGIDERLKALSGGDAYKVAESVYDDIIEPELVNIDRKLNTALSKAARRYGLSAAVGATISTVGLLSFAPIAATGVAVSAAASLATYMDWSKKKEEVETSDLHFLWRLEQKASRHADH